MPKPTLDDILADRTDWARLAAKTDEEIEFLAETDPDNPATDEAFWANAIRFPDTRKTQVHAKFDADVVAWFKAGGRGYQARMNEVLRRAMEAEKGRRSA